jgi:PAS domain-containing protein
MIEDQAEDAELLLREMRRGGLNILSSRVETEIEFQEALDNFEPDLILSDYTLPAFRGPVALQIARLRRPHIPFIFVSGTIGEERAIDALRQGAVDYVLKDSRARLVPAIERALREAKERTAGRRTEEALRASEERFRSIADATQEWIWEIDAGGTLTFCSPAIESILGTSRAALIGKNFLDFMLPATRQTVEEILRRNPREKGAWRDMVFEYRH